MTSERKIQANRENAKLAGVKTENGKSISRFNSFKHGLRAEALLSKSENLKESEEEYLLIVEGLRNSLKPQNYFEESLLESMAKAQFKLRRFDVLEATSIEKNLRKFGSIWEAEAELSRLSNFLKYKQSLEAQFYRALEFFHRHRHFHQLDLFEKLEDKPL